MPLHYITLHYTQCNCIGHLFVISHTMKVIIIIFCIPSYSTFNLNDYVWQSFLIFYGTWRKFTSIILCFIFFSSQTSLKNALFDKYNLLFGCRSWGCYSRLDQTMGSLLHFQFTGSFAFPSNQCSIGPRCFNASLVLRCSGGSSCGERTPYGAPNPLKGQRERDVLAVFCGCEVKRVEGKGGCEGKVRLPCWEMFLWAEELQRCERKHCGGMDGGGESQRGQSSLNQSQVQKVGVSGCVDG